METHRKAHLRTVHWHETPWGSASETGILRAKPRVLQWESPILSAEINPFLVKSGSHRDFNTTMKIQQMHLGKDDKPRELMPCRTLTSFVPKLAVWLQTSFPHGISEIQVSHITSIHFCHSAGFLSEELNKILTCIHYLFVWKLCF